MAVRRKVIDIEDGPELLRLIEEMRESREERVLRHNGEEVAVIRPVVRPTRRRRIRAITQEDIDELRSAAGSWKDVDTDRLLEDIYADRDMSIGRTGP
jgi:hypothetical protein